METLDKDIARGKRIRDARLSFGGVTQEGLAKGVSEALGSEISRGAIGNWERGYGMTMRNLKALAAVLNVNHKWLLTGKGPSSPNIGLEPLTPTDFVGGKPPSKDLIRKLDDDQDFEGHPEDLTDLNAALINIPEYNVRASMGDGFVVDRESIKGSWPFAKSYLVNELRLQPKQLVVIEVVGDSMSPTLESGDRVVVDMGDQRISNPGIFVLWDGDGTVAKRIELVPNSKPQKLMRISDNPLHGRYEVLAEETNIIGRIVWFARRL